MRDEYLEPDFVYLTHHHFDHFHYPSMRRIAKKATVLIPRFAVDVMPGEVRSLGFERVRELEHGARYEIAEDMEVASFQFGPDNSTFLIRSGGIVLADINDGKPEGATLRRIRSTFGPPTFAFKSHSWAQAYPVRYEADDSVDLSLITEESYVDSFRDTVTELGARFAVPFASMACFLHPESVDVNDRVITPSDLQRKYADGQQRPELVLMSPGDRWNSDTGFDCGGIDWYEPEVRAANLAELRELVRRDVDTFDELLPPNLEWERFQTYFAQFISELPRALLYVLIPRPIVFLVATDVHTPFWTIDARRRQVQRRAIVDIDAASVITVQSGLLADAISKRIVNLLHISMRLRVRLHPGGADADLAFWGLLEMWELGYFPIRRLKARRAIGVALRRRREMLDALRKFVTTRGSFAERMTNKSRSATPTDGDAADRAA